MKLNMGNQKKTENQCSSKNGHQGALFALFIGTLPSQKP
jgi:hypothetical protein